MVDRLRFCCAADAGPGPGRGPGRGLDPGGRGAEDEAAAALRSSSSMSFLLASIAQASCASSSSVALRCGRGGREGRAGMDAVGNSCAGGVGGAVSGKPAGGWRGYCCLPRVRSWVACASRRDPPPSASTEGSVVDPAPAGGEIRLREATLGTGSAIGGGGDRVGTDWCRSGSPGCACGIAI